MAKEGIETELEEIPSSIREPKNIVEKLRFEDETTRARCRGWLTLKSSKPFLKANIIFPGSDVDCRLSVRARSGNVVLQPVLKDCHVCFGACFTTMLYLGHENEIPSVDLGRGRGGIMPVLKDRECSSSR